MCFQVFRSSLEITSPDAFNLYGFIEVLKAICHLEILYCLSFTFSLMCSQVCWDRASGRNCRVGLLRWPPVPACRVHDLEGASPSAPPPPRWSRAPPLYHLFKLSKRHQDDIGTGVKDDGARSHPVFDLKWQNVKHRDMHDLDFVQSLARPPLTLLFTKSSYLL